MLPLGRRTVNAFADGTKDRKSTRLNSSHGSISYGVFCLKKIIVQYKVSFEMLTVVCWGSIVQIEPIWIVLSCTNDSGRTTDTDLTVMQYVISTAWIANLC